MLNEKLKRAMCGLVASLCVAGCTVPVFAETVPFDITVPGVIVSKKALKSDSEQRFYVRGTSFSSAGTLYCTSINLNDSTIKSNTASISQSRLLDTASYRKYAPVGQYYHMTVMASVSNLRVTGKYAP
ncbi:MAG: hypothetical protein Q4D16_14185 [Eubacteriales bacterium]|nr:hypothetical protein [Eubacteriales bacterium]